LGGSRLVVSRRDCSFDIFDAETLQHLVEAYERLPYAPVAVSPDGALVACGESELRLFDGETFDLVGCMSLGHKISALCFAESARVVAVSTVGRWFLSRSGRRSPADTSISLPTTASAAAALIGRPVDAVCRRYPPSPPSIAKAWVA
jgi:hypothetical protein